MTLRDKVFLSILPAALLGSTANSQTAPAPQPAPAPTAAAGFTAGATVKDTQGEQVGTILRADGEFVILKTDKHEVRLPKSSFTAHQGGFIMAMSRDQVNAAVDQTLAQASAKIVAGVTVTGAQGGPVGTIERVDAEFVTVKLGSGALVRLPRAAVAPSPTGAAVSMTGAELEAAASGATAQ